jgi:CubicO group peptidase (beta-lactamase class C family)
MDRHALTHRLLAALLALALALAMPAGATTRPELDQRMQQLVGTTPLDGAALWVSHRGELMHRGFYGDYGPTTQVPIASASKWLSALVLARLVERGTLRLDSTVGEWFPEAPRATHRITLAQLFSHTSGLPGDERGCIARPFTTLQACALAILSEPLIAAPGTAFAYGGLSMQVAGAMAERASGMPWARLFRDEVVVPLGLRATDYAVGLQAVTGRPPSNPRIGGGIRSTLDDYARVVAMWLAEGRTPGGVYLQPSTLRAFEADRTRGARRLDVPPGVAGQDFGYGIGLWRLPAPGGHGTMVSSPGAFGFTPWVDRGGGVAGVFLVKDRNLRMAPAVRELQRMIAAATRNPAVSQDDRTSLHSPLSSQRTDGPLREPGERTAFPDHGGEHHRGHPGGQRWPGDLRQPQRRAPDRRAVAGTAGHAVHGIHPSG